MEIPGCTTFTATDRKYIIEHMWIKMVAENIVAVGITEKMSELMDLIYTMDLPDVGKLLQKEGFFGYSEAGKMNVEFVSPVSGEVVDINPALKTNPELVFEDPYGKGWLFKVKSWRLSEQLRSLLSDKVAGSWMKATMDRLKGTNTELGLVAQDGGELCENLVQHLDRHEWIRIVRETLGTEVMHSEEG